jgi:hypothetical protein
MPLQLSHSEICHYNSCIRKYAIIISSFLEIGHFVRTRMPPYISTLDSLTRRPHMPSPFSSPSFPIVQSFKVVWSGRVYSQQHRDGVVGRRHTREVPPTQDALHPEAWRTGSAETSPSFRSLPWMRSQIHTQRARCRTSSLPPSLSRRRPPPPPPPTGGPRHARRWCED